MDLLTSEVNLLGEGKEQSERLLCFTSLLLHRDVMIKKTSDVRRILTKRMDLWKSEQYEALLYELERCEAQNHVQRPHKVDEAHAIRVFSRLMLSGKVRDATRWITGHVTGGVFAPTDIDTKTGKTVLQSLKDKHPPPGRPDPSAFLTCDVLPPLTDVDIVASHIEKTAHKIRGAAGPSGTDSMQWQSFLLRYGSYSGELREAMAVLTRRLANSVVDWGDIKALMANRLIALDKSPGVRPIGIGECIRRVIGKTMALVTGRDVQDVCGVEQLATGLKASIEGAIHAMTDLYNEFASDSWGFLLIDAVNAFNMINRTTALWNARVLWPRCSRFLFNTYRGYSMLILKDTKECIYSKEGVTQGDPLSMFFYAVAVLPLIRSLASNSNFVQCWYADDSACAGMLSQIRLWLEKLIQLGPAYGYFAEPTKSVLVVAPQFEDVAKNCSRIWESQCQAAIAFWVV